MAAVLALLGIDRAWVVHGADGLDEITLTGETFIAECSMPGRVRTFTISPNDFGLAPQRFNQPGAGGPSENAQVIRALLNCENGAGLSAAGDLVIANAAAALHIAGVAKDLCEAAALARESIETGRAAAKMDALVRETNRNG
jgi:anthranilate phosphoribosyltransferase